MSEELKPCPFCGGPNVERYMAGIECADCGARAPDDLTWNKRASRDAEVQRLREALELYLAAGIGNSSDWRKQLVAFEAARAALKEQQ
jgi:hypothetical protein